MPIFEFVCSECGHPFEELLRTSDAIAGLTCPQCGSPQVKKKLSTFASKVSGGDFSTASASSTAHSCSPGGG